MKKLAIILLLPCLANAQTQSMHAGGGNIMLNSTEGKGLSIEVDSIDFYGEGVKIKLDAPYAKKLYIGETYSLYYSGKDGSLNIKKCRLFKIEIVDVNLNDYKKVACWFAKE